jgi:hypothetical protein
VINAASTTAYILITNVQSSSFSKLRSGDWVRPNPPVTQFSKNSEKKTRFLEVARFGSDAVDRVNIALSFNLLHGAHINQCALHSTSVHNYAFDNARSATHFFGIAQKGVGKNLGKNTGTDLRRPKLASPAGIEPTSKV